jgi:histidine triad (HIT) family protein
MENLDQSCIFCSIVAGDAPAEVVYHDDQVVAIKDANPQAPVHVLLITREHNLESLNDASKLDVSLLGHLLYTAAKVANQMDIAESGYRVVINNAEAAGQSVPHLHVHILGGRPLAWPPG